MSRLIAPATAFLILITTIAFSPLARTTDSWEGVEVARIRAHFDSVLVELTARDVGGLSETQQAMRSQLIVTLAGYRDRGVFPHNYDFPAARTPYFVDRETGTRCAVAYLLESTGRSDIVLRVARGDNNVRVVQLAGDTALTAWLDASGLTLDEAARIQPEYGVILSAPPPTPRMSPTLKVVAPVTLATTVVSGIWNATANRDGHKPVGNILGVTTGAASTGLGVGLLMQNRTPRGVGATMLAAGGISLVLASHAIYRHAVVMHDQREGVRASVAPFVTQDGDPGVSMAISF